MTIRDRMQALIDEIKEARADLRKSADLHRRLTQEYYAIWDRYNRLLHNFYGETCEAMLEAEQ